VDSLYLDVFQNGIKLKAGDDYTATTGTSVVLVQGASANDVVEMVAFDVFSVGDTVSAGSGGSFGGNIGIGGTLAVTGASTLSSSLAMTSNDPTITMTDSSGTNDIVTLQSTSGALIVTARDGNANGEIIFKGDTGSAVTEHMRINNAGIITKPLQPAFQVLPANTDQANLAINTTHTIAFGTERFDNNADFASNTFTAPVTGKYQLNVSLYFTGTDADATYIQLNLVTSNKTYYSIYDPAAFDEDPTYWTLGCNVLADMDASDTALVQVIQGGGSAQLDIAVDTNFSGYLVA
jgi:hypothetical protein